MSRRTENTMPKWADLLAKTRLGGNIRISPINETKTIPNQERVSTFSRYNPSKREFWLTEETIIRWNGIHGNKVKCNYGKDSFSYTVSICRKNGPVVIVGDHKKVGYAKVLKATHNGKEFYKAPDVPETIAVI